MSINFYPEEKSKRPRKHPQEKANKCRTVHPCLSSAVLSHKRLKVTAFASLGKRPKCFDAFRGRFPSLELLFGFVFLVSRQEKGK